MRRLGSRGGDGVGSELLPAYCYPRYAIAAAVDLLNEPVEVRS